VEVVRANGLEIAYERVGDGPPVVFVHGAAVDARMWQPQLAALADEFTVVAWDEPGAGRSSDVPADFGLADYAACLAALIDALDLGPAHVPGLSWGGTVAQELYRHHPEFVATLILVDTYAGWKGSLPKDEVRIRVQGVRQMLAAADHLFDPTLPGLFAGDPPAEFVPLLEAMAADVRPEPEDCAAGDGRGRRARSAAAYRRADPLDLGRARRALAAQRRASVREGHLGHEARRDLRRWSREQPRAARGVQRRRPRVLPRSLAAFTLNRRFAGPEVHT
jgi:pimeloyl-ACP methyl ester carboxylesterase